MYGIFEDNLEENLNEHFYCSVLMVAKRRNDLKRR